MSLSNDIRILHGISSIVNLANIKPGIDPQELEKQMITAELNKSKPPDPKDKFAEELREAARKLGIEFGSSYDVAKPPADTDNDSASPSADESSPAAADDIGLDFESAAVTLAPIAAAKPLVEDRDVAPSTADINRPASPPPVARPTLSRELQERTFEQERRSHIDAVMGTTYNMNTPSSAVFSFEREKREDSKCQMLAEIDYLIRELEDSGVDLSRIPKVDRHSDYDEVETTLRILRHKMDHTRYCSFANEFLLFGAYALEELFDGKRTWFGRYQPDLTGWHNEVNVKLRRMQHDTGQIVSTLMHDYNIGPGARVLLELIPSMVIYSKTRKMQHSQPDLYSEEEIIRARERIRNLN